MLKRSLELMVSRRSCAAARFDQAALKSARSNGLDCKQPENLGSLIGVAWPLPTRGAFGTGSLSVGPSAGKANTVVQVSVRGSGPRRTLSLQSRQPMACERDQRQLGWGRCRSFVYAYLSEVVVVERGGFGLLGRRQRVGEVRRHGVGELIAHRRGWLCTAHRVAGHSLVK